MVKRDAYHAMEGFREMSDYNDSTSVPPDRGRYRVLVPLANPQHERDLIELASAIAKQRDGVIDAIHIVTVPDQTALGQAAEHVDKLDAESAELLASARADAETFGVDIKAHTILSHRGFEQIFDAARTHEADVVVMGWGDHGHARAEPRLDELTGPPPCDFLVLRDRGFDPDRVLVPTAGGPNSGLSTEVATLLHREYGSEVTVLHVADDPDEGELFLREWTDDYQLEDATLRIKTDEVEATIERTARDATMVIMGATEQGLLARLVTGSLVMEVVDELECSLLLTERPTTRSLRDRLFGAGA